jgi:hypothetical protein
MEIIFHIGTHKTGTTSIQNYLFDNKLELEMDGVLYPSSGCTNTKAHHNLVYQSVGSWKYKESFGGWGELKDEILNHGAKKVIISAENFSGYYRKNKILDDIKFLCKELDANPVIIACIRPQVEYIDSIYSQNCATGYETKKYKKYLLSSLANPAFDFEQLLGRWFDEFSDVRLVDYAKVKDFGIDYFFSTIGCDFPGSLAGKNRMLNTRRSAHVVEFCRKAGEILNGVKGVSAEDKHAVVLRVAKATSMKFDATEPFSGMDQEEFNLINCIFKIKNDAFFKKRDIDKDIVSSFDSVQFKGEKKNVLELDECIEDRGEFLKIYTESLLGVC